MLGCFFPPFPFVFNFLPVGLVFLSSLTAGVAKLHMASHSCAFSPEVLHFCNRYSISGAVSGGAGEAAKITFPFLFLCF